MLYTSRPGDSLQGITAHSGVLSGTAANVGPIDGSGSPVRGPRVLHSFPHKIGADRICTTAWQLVEWASNAGADVTLYTGVVHKELSRQVDIRTTLARGRIRLPYRLLGRLRTLAIHDAIVARALPSLASQIDVVHTWPLAALRTLRVAAELGIPTVLERPNAHTRFAYAVVREECERLGVELPPDHEHAYNAEILRREEIEYEAADYLLCPSTFTEKTFVDQGFPPEKLLRHTYGFDPLVFSPLPDRPATDGLTVLYVGVAAVRKGLHLALDAWLRSSASSSGTFLIAGGFVPDYRRHLEAQLAHPSVRVLGHRDDVPALMRGSDALVLPSLEEGFGLVCAEAIGSGCVPLVSDRCTELCRHFDNALVHSAGDVEALSQHLTELHENRFLLEKLRAGALRDAPNLTWEHAGATLREAYIEAISRFRARQASPNG